MACIPIDKIRNLIRNLPNNVTTDLSKDKTLRANVQNTKPETIVALFKKGTGAIKNLFSKPLKNKLDNALDIVSKPTTNFYENLNYSVIDSDTVIEDAIALQEIIESIKGESDKVYKLKIPINKVTQDGNLPVVLMSRLSAVIGRKVAYQKGYRFKNDKNSPATPTEIEYLYKTIGDTVIINLEKRGLLNIQDNVDSIKDYIDPEVEYIASRKPGDLIVKGMQTISINLSNIAQGAETGLATEYMLDRKESDLSGSGFNTFISTLKIINYVSQPVPITFPSKVPLTDAQLEENDDITLTPKYSATRKALNNNPQYINTSVDSLMRSLSEAVQESDVNASTYVKNFFKGNERFLADMFGFYNSDQYSRDRKENIQGKTRSKTVAFDDLVEHYNDINGDGKSAIHIALFGGRNIRSYTTNNVLDAHSSKHSRHMLTSGEYSLDVGTAPYNFMVDKVARVLGVSTDEVLDISTTKGSVNNNRLNTALEAFEVFKSSNDAKSKLGRLSFMSKEFSSLDFAELVTVLQAVQDIRNPVNGVVTSEFNVSSDATSSGGNLTFIQALGTHPAVKKLLTELGILGNNPDDKVLNDVYAIMSGEMNDYVHDKFKASDIAVTDDNRDINNTKDVMKNILESLYKGNLRNFAKPPTMTFIYKQGKYSATENLSSDIASDIIDNLKDPKVVKLLNNLLEGTDYADKVKNKNAKGLNKIKGLHEAIVESVKSSGVPGKLFELMESSIKDKYLSSQIKQSKSIFQLIKDLGIGTSFKILPATAVLEGIEPTKANLAKYGVPVSKIFSVLRKVNGEHVFTQEQRLMQSVMDVSQIHGIDAAQLYGSIHEILVKGGSKRGVTVVHDDFRSDPKTVMAIEEVFVRITKEINEKFSIHDQVLKAILANDPNVVNNAEYNRLRNEVTKTDNAKVEALKDYNENNSAIIGDGKVKPVTSKLADSAKEKFDEVSTESKMHKIVTTKHENRFTENEISSFLDKFSKDSKIIRMYLSLKNRPSIGSNLSNSYSPDEDRISIVDYEQNIDGEKVYIDVSTKHGEKRLKMLIEHEITHSLTFKHINDLASSGDTRLTYLSNALADLQFNRLIERTKIKAGKGDPLLSDAAKSRIGYIGDMYKISPILGINELVAIIKAEPELASEIYKFMSSPKDLNKFKAAIKYITESIDNFVKSLTRKQLDAAVDPKIIDGIINSIVQEGFVKRLESSPTKISNKGATEDISKVLGIGPTDQKKAGVTLGAGPSAHLKRNALNYLNYAAYSIVNSKLEKGAVKLGTQLDKVLAKNFPMYVRAKNRLEGIYDDSDALQQIVHSITNNKIDRIDKNEIITQSTNIESAANNLRDTQLNLFHKVLTKVSKKDKEKLHNFITKVPLHDYFILSNSINSTDGITDRIKELEKIVSKSIVKGINSIIDMNINEVVTKDTWYNLSSNISIESDLAVESRELLALKSIEALGSADFINILNNNKLVNLLKDNTIANKMNTLTNDGSNNLRDSIVAEYYDSNMVKKAVTKEEIKDYINNSDWKVIQEPNGNKLGIIAKEIIDSTYLKGVYTDIKLQSSDITVSSSMKNFDNVVKVGDSYKLVLTEKNKNSLGIVKSPEQNLVRTMAHSSTIADTQAIRDKIIESKVFSISKTSEKELIGIINDDTKESPWFLKLSEGMEYKDLPDKIKARYKLTGNRTSDIKGFNAKVDLVRKDSEQWLMGANAKSLVTNKKLQYAMRVTKGLISGSKLGMVVLNPLKIVADNMSNLSYLSVIINDPIFVAKSYNDINKEYQEHIDIRNKIVLLKLKNKSSGTYSKKIKALEKRLKNLKIHNVYDKGFSNSIGSDLINKNSDNLSGLGADFHKGLEFLLNKDNGNNNLFSHYIMQLTKVGGNAEDFVSYIGGKLSKYKSTESLAVELNSMAKRIKQIKNDDDVVNYMIQFTTSPTSEAVRLGAFATDLGDILAKETLYRYSVEKEGMSEEAATIRVLESFPDYKENMPLAIKQLSDMGILMFPSFWLRIQKVIYRMARDKPVSIGTELMIEDLLGVNFESIINSNIVNKFNSFGGIIKSPDESIGLNSIVNPIFT